MYRGDLDFDLGLSVLFWRKLKGEMLNSPKFGVVNFHPAPLPEYKGVGGYNLAILEGLERWGATAHYMDEDIDTGPIITLKQFDIDIDNETARSLEKKTQDAIYKLFGQTLKILLNDPGRVPTIPNGPGRYVTRKQLEEMKTIDFAADDINRKVRAFWFPPYDGACVDIQGEKFTLVNRSILEDLADPDVSSLFAPAAYASDDEVGANVESAELHKDPAYEKLRAAS